MPFEGLSRASAQGVVPASSKHASANVEKWDIARQSQGNPPAENRNRDSLPLRAGPASFKAAPSHNNHSLIRGADEVFFSSIPSSHVAISKKLQHRNPSRRCLKDLPGEKIAQSASATPSCPWPQGLAVERTTFFWTLMQSRPM